MGTIVASPPLAWSAAVWLNLCLFLTLSLALNRAALGIALCPLDSPRTVYVRRKAGGYPKPWDSLEAAKAFLTDKLFCIGM